MDLKKRIIWPIFEALVLIFLGIVILYLFPDLKNTDYFYRYFFNAIIIIFFFNNFRLDWKSNKFTALGAYTGVTAGLIIGIIYWNISTSFIIGGLVMVLGIAIGIDLDKKAKVRIEKLLKLPELKNVRIKELKQRLAESYLYLFFGLFVLLSAFIGIFLKFIGIEIDPIESGWLVYFVSMGSLLPYYGQALIVLFGLAIAVPIILKIKNIRRDIQSIDKKDNREELSKVK